MTRRQSQQGRIGPEVQAFSSKTATSTSDEFEQALSKAFPRPMAIAIEAGSQIPDYIMAGEAIIRLVSFKSKFADLPTFGLWADRTQSDDELLEELGSGWRGFTTEQ